MAEIGPGETCDRYAKISKCAASTVPLKTKQVYRFELAFVSQKAMPHQLSKYIKIYLFIKNRISFPEIPLVVRWLKIKKKLYTVGQMEYTLV